MVYHRGSPLTTETLMWAKYIMPTVTGFINQTDYSMSQALTNKEK